MRRIFKIGAFCLCSLCIASCNYLDVEPNEFVTDEDVWSDVRQAEKLVNRVYSLIDNGGGNGINVAGEITAATDEAKHHWENPWIWKIAQGGWNPSDNNLDFWRSRYEDIRIANQFLANIDNVKFPENEETYWAIKISQYVGEVRVLRAWFYYQLLERY
ncbi:MAG: RagB/SusD family nutrient uptake outer membrane protein, partial [Bacteroides sp.]